MSNNTTAAAPTVTQWSERDDYGRTVRHFAVNGRTVCVRVSIPKRTRHLVGYDYIVNDWATARKTPGADTATMCLDMADAKTAAAAIVAREVDAAS